MTDSVYTYSDYKDLLRTQLATTWGAVSRAADAAGCQRSYLSRVMRGHVHLTPDQVYGLSDFFELTPTEAEYFLTLLEHARAGSPAYRTHLERKLAQFRRDHENLSKRLERPSLETGEKELTYYSSWYWSAVHILVSIPAFRSPEAIAARLNLPLSLVRATLESLQIFGLIGQKGGHWVFHSGDLHVPKQSLLVGLHHNNWRQRAVLDAQTPGQDAVHYTVVQSMSRAAFAQIKARLLEFIDDSARIAGPSKEEELVCVTCDLFRV